MLGQVSVCKGAPCTHKRLELSNKRRELKTLTLGVRDVQYLAGGDWEFLRFQDVFQSYLSNVTDRKVLTIKNMRMFLTSFFSVIFFCLFDLFVYI